MSYSQGMDCYIVNQKLLKMCLLLKNEDQETSVLFPALPGILGMTLGKYSLYWPDLLSL